MKKLLLQQFLLFFLCVIHGVIRNVKDAVILTGNSSGAEVIPFIQLWAMMPAALLFSLSFAVLSRWISRKTLFYSYLAAFLSFFTFYVYVIAPNPESWQLNLELGLPSGWKGFEDMAKNLPATAFYVAAELWPTAMICVLFWGFSHELNTPEEAKQSYGFIKLGGTISAFSAGLFAQLVCADNWQATMQRELWLILALGFLSAIFFYQLTLGLQFEQVKAAKTSGRFFHSLKLLSQDRYLMHLAVLVVGYNVCFNLADIYWKQQIRSAYPNPQDLMTYMNGVMMAVGIISFAGALFSSLLVKHLGWGFLAGITPLAMLVTLALFFSGLLMGVDPVLLVTVGAYNNCLSKAGKYSVFDVSKEMAFTQLEPERRWQGKTAIDGIGNDVGKTGASLTQQFLLIIVGSLSKAAPIIASIILSTLILWIFSVYAIGRKFTASQPEFSTN